MELWTTEDLAERLLLEPKGTKVLLGDSDGGSSSFLAKQGQISSWEQEDAEGMPERVILLTNSMA